MKPKSCGWKICERLSITNNHHNVYLLFGTFYLSTHLPMDDIFGGHLKSFGMNTSQGFFCHWFCITTWYLRSLVQMIIKSLHQAIITKVIYSGHSKRIWNKCYARFSHHIFSITVTRVSKSALVQFTLLPTSGTNHHQKIKLRGLPLSLGMINSVRICSSQNNHYHDKNIYILIGSINPSKYQLTPNSYTEGTSSEFE